MSQINVINICDLLDELFGGRVPANLGEAARQCAKLMGWCESNNAHYYAQPSEQFSVEEAMREARRAGCAQVVVENLS